MKRILLVSFIGLILAGCGKDKITKEYLVGEWSCNAIIDYIGYDQPISRVEPLTTFKLFDGKLYGALGDDRLECYDLDYTLNNPIQESAKGEDYVRTKEYYEKINNNKYKYTYTLEVIGKNETANAHMGNGKIELISTRYTVQNIY